MKCDLGPGCLASRLAKCMQPGSRFKKGLFVDGVLQGSYRVHFPGKQEVKHALIREFDRLVVGMG